MHVLAHAFKRIRSDFAKAQGSALNAAGHYANVFGFGEHMRQS